MNIGVAACGVAMLLFVVVGALFALLKGKAALRRPSIGDVAIGPAIESDDPFARARRLGRLDDPGAMRRVDVAELIGHVGRDGIAAIRAGFCFFADWHAARIALTGDSVYDLHDVGCFTENPDFPAGSYSLN